MPFAAILTREGSIFNSFLILFAESAAEIPQLYAAARYFEEHSTTIKTREGVVSVFCFD